jgi:hypothetical protein
MHSRNSGRNRIKACLCLNKNINSIYLQTEEDAISFNKLNDRSHIMQRESPEYEE